MTAAIHVVLLIAVGVIWPASAGLLGAAIWGRHAAASPVIAVLLADMPFAFFSWGPLWPYALAMCLLPVALLLTMVIVRRPSSEHDRTCIPDGMILGSWLVACLAIHPSVIVWWLAIALLMVAFSASHPRLPTGTAARFGVALAFMVVLWGAIAAVAPQSMRPIATAQVEAPLVATIVVGVAVVASPLFVVALWMILTVLGVVRAARLPGSLWLGAAWTFLFGLYGARVAFPHSWVRAVAWPWWDDPRRIEAVLGLLAVLATAGVIAAVASDVSNFVVSRVPQAADIAAQLPALVLCVLLVGSVGSNAEALSAVYGPRYVPADRPLLPRAALESLAAALPADSLVAANPRRGSVYLYALGGPRVLYPTWGSPTTPDLVLVGARLADLQTDGAVCAAAHRQGITHLMVGGPLDGLTIPRVADYSGVDRVTGSFRMVAQSAPFAVYELPECVESYPARGAGT